MARPGLTNHRKFRRLARVLGSLPIARGALELLWEHCYESGEPYVGTADDLEQLVGWDGDRGALTRALVEAGQPEGAGFVELSPRTVDGVATYQVHNLYRHAPDYVARRRKREQARVARIDPAVSDRSVTVSDRSVAADRPSVTGQWRPSLDSQSGLDRTPSPSPSHSPPPSPSPAPALAARPREFGRLRLHPWQLQELLRLLGPHAKAFDLDAWLFGLAPDRVLPAGREFWPWVQAEVLAEARRRGLPIAEAAPALTPKEQRIAATREALRSRG